MAFGLVMNDGYNGEKYKLEISTEIYFLIQK